MLFSYKVRNKLGEIIEGTINAPSESVAVDALHTKDYTILTIRPSDRGLLAIDVNNLFQRIKNRDIVAFTRQLSVLIDADVPLSEALRILASQEGKPIFKKMISSISESIEGGSSFSVALTLYPKLFTNFYIMLVQTGEVSGRLHQSLLYLAEYLERSQSINSKIKGALAYPAFIVFALFIVSIIMVVYVLPNLLSIFEDLGGDVELPITTRALIFITDFVNAYKLPVFGAILGIGFWLYSYARTEKGKRHLDELKISIPSLGTVAKNLYLARVAESLSVLIKSGIPILDAIKLTADLVGNVIYRDILLESEKNVRSGGSISETMSKRKEVPALFSSMMSVGERIGKLDYILEHISAFYKAESENTIQNISQLIEPVLILVLGFGVAILVSSVLLPIYNVVGVG